MKKIILSSIEETRKLAKMISQASTANEIIFLKGNLGAGKTAFSQSYIEQKLGIKTEVTSPTFNLVNIYENKEISIWHYDLYRVKSINEAIELGLLESVTNYINLIEWPEMIEDLAIKNILMLNFLIIDENSREVQIIAKGSWVDRLDKLL